MSRAKEMRKTFAEVTQDAGIEPTLDYLGTSQVPTTDRPTQQRQISRWRLSYTDPRFGPMVLDNISGHQLDLVLAGMCLVQYGRTIGVGWRSAKGRTG